MLVHNAAYRGEQPLLAKGTRPGGVTQSPPPPPSSLGHLFRDSVLQSSLWLRLAGLMVGPQLTLMGTRMEGVDIGALRSLIFKLSQGGEKRSAWTNSVARLCKMKIKLTLITVDFFFFLTLRLWFLLIWQTVMSFIAWGSFWRKE